ncbi:MAG: hypothetical protein KC431_18795, partial [Myxococcales bacterium]|nr:hypothetical protein [Myxococcales bacterium]
FSSFLGNTGIYISFSGNLDTNSKVKITETISEPGNPSRSHDLGSYSNNYYLYANNDTYNVFSSDLTQIPNTTATISWSP